MLFDRKHAWHRGGHRLAKTQVTLLHIPPLSQVLGCFSHLRALSHSHAALLRGP